MNNFYWRTWAEIDLDTLKNNINEIKKLAGDKELRLFQSVASHISPFPIFGKRKG